MAAADDVEDSTEPLEVVWTDLMVVNAEADDDSTETWELVWSDPMVVDADDDEMGLVIDRLVALTDPLAICCKATKSTWTALESS